MTTTKKTSTTPPAPVRAERVKASKHELSEATAGLIAAQAALEAAEGAVATMRQGRQAGDQSVTAEGLAIAHAEVVLSGDDLTFATDRLKRAERNVLNDDTSIVAAVASALADYSPLSGITIVPTTETPSIPATIERPTLYLVQTAAPKHDTVTGRSSGLVEAYLHRPTWGISLDVDDLPDYLARTQVYTDARSLGSAKRGEVMEDRASLSVRGIWQEVPVIDKPNRADIFGQTLAGRVAQHLSRGRRGNVAQPHEGGVGSTTALASAVMAQGEGRITGTTMSGGKRHTTVEVTMALRSSVVGRSMIAEESTAYLMDRVGTCESGLGRVASVEMMPTDEKSSNPHSPMRLGVRFVLVSLPK
ncbi:hypothetical protein [Nocardioides pacificus]